MQFSPSTIRWLGLVLALSGLCVSACSQNGVITALGYTVGQRHCEDIKTVRVPIFRNRTLVRDIEYEITQAVVQRIHQATPWRVVQSGNADAELVGTVVLLGKRQILQNEQNEVRDAELTLGVEIIFHDCRTGANLMKPGQDLLPAIPPVADATQPMSVPSIQPILLQRTAGFIPEIGESYATARQRVIQEIAVQIVNVLENPW